MRTLKMLNWLSVDGLFAGPHGEREWVVDDPEVPQAAHALIHADTAVFGRVTYEEFASYWPFVLSNPDASPEARMMATELGQMTKVVCSTTLQAVTWENSRLVREHIAEEVRHLKGGEGADIVLFGSGTLVRQLAAAGLIDEYVIVLTPVVLGAGQALFEKSTHRTLELLTAQAFPSGTVLLHYRDRDAVSARKNGSDE